MPAIFFRPTLFAATLAACLFLEAALAASSRGYLPVPPLALVAVAAWMPAFPVVGRLWLLGSAGFVMDTFGPDPFGTRLLSALAAALAAEMLMRVSTRESAAGRVGVPAALAAFMWLSAPLARASAGYISAFLL
ncbi:MAG: hypothetical protein AAB533_03900 [Patescibacteria group bacterium]